ncbi:DMT family transporter [Methylocella sp. CPCC 101449]|uniref:DMT family transporter n=1 Tax=Methylocella sp. CPCC 101449 TaxID=2987531 RepID=UPI0028928A6D|nr:DMT family transporter [Methylocella sp. CPCC 101449]MDT2021044.1 DMT family transporter [Methylocella sp. CPCC 101449]
MKLAATAFFSVMFVLAKSYGTYPAAQLVFFRSAFALVPLMIWLLLRGDFPRALYTSRFGGHLVRSVAGIGSLFCSFIAYSLLPLADATAIGYAAPLMIVVLAGLLLGERITVFRWGAVVVGFCGVLVMLSDHLTAGIVSDKGAIGAMVAFVGAMLVSIAMIQTRRLTMSEDTGAITFYFQATTTVAGVLVLVAAACWPSNWPLAVLIQPQAWVWPTLQDWGPLILIGICGGIGQIFMTQGYRFTDASILAVFDYSSLLFAIVLGFLIFGDVPSHVMLAGAAVVISAGLAVLWHERRRMGKKDG